MTNYIRAQKFKIEDGVYKFLKYAELEDNIGLHADGIYFSEQITADGAKWFYYAEDSQTFKKYIKAHENGSFHELIIFDDDKRNRLYFDVDLKHNNPNDIAEAISRFMKNAIESKLELYSDDPDQLDDIDISVYEFITDRSDKFSAHYIVPNVYATRDMNIVFAQDINRQARINKLVSKGVDICDIQVYKPRSQSLRINGFAKYGDTARKQFKPEYSTDITPDICDTLVQWRNWYDTATIDYEHNKQFADFIAHNNKMQKFDKTPTMDKSNLPELNKLADILEHLAPKRAEEYKYWIRVCFACAVFGEDARAIMHKWASKAKNYDKAACNRAFDRANGNTGFGTLMYYLKEDAPDYILEIKNIQNTMSETDPHIALLESMFSDGDVATYFCYIHKDEFKLYNEVLYYFNGCYWEQSSTGVIYNKLNDIYFSLLDKLNTYFGDKEYIEFYTNTLTKKLIKLRTSKNLKNIWDSIKFRIEIKDDIWDSNPYLLGFINGTYDLKQNIFRKADKLDYISQIVPYEFKEVEQSEIDFAMQYFNKIFPNESERDFFLKSLSTCLDGKLLENIIFALGNGRNGKDTILTMIMKRVLGDDLYYDAPNSIIIDKIKAGANPEIANMHKKRLIVYSEPNKHAILNCANIKQLTGTEVMPVRGLYSSNNKTKMCCTQFIMQNKLLTMDSPDDAMLNRLYVIPFRAMFRTEEKLAELPSDTQFAYLVDSYYKSIEFFERIKLPFMHILLQYYQIFQKEGNILKNAPKSILDASKKYISDSDNFVCWFNECYKHSDNENDCVKLKDIYEKFKSSDLWANMNKAERRKMTRTKLEKDIIENPTLRAFFRDRIKINEVHYRSVMIKYKIKSYDSDDSDEE